jgi:hypothetical protein
MHLVVDASVPEHTRNDEHPLGPFFGNYEYWVDSLHKNTEAERQFVATFLASPVQPDTGLLDQPTNDSAAPVPVARLIDADVYDGSDPNVTLTSAIGIAEFANANFFSEDSGYRRFFSPTYPYPSIEGLVPSRRPLQRGPWTRAYYRKGQNDGLPVDPVLAECALDAAFRGDGIPAPQRKCTDSNVWEQTALVMLPRAVGYAAALIDYFFRGGIGVEYENENRSLRIAGSSEPMIGDFRLLYERSDGSRVELAAWTGIRIEADDLSQTLSTPQLPADVEPGVPCWLVFRGQLGLEPGAVLGALVGCPTVPPPPPPPPERGPWVVYHCTTFNTTQNYFYATTDPPMWDFEPAVNFFYVQRSTGTGFNCGRMTWGLTEQPPGTTTEHPV